jgi:putative addiction module component (TIGR02574 family)
MSSTARKILEDALALSDAERRELGEALLDTVAPDWPPDLADAWRKEIVARMDGLAKGDPTAEWSEVHERLRAKLPR